MVPRSVIACMTLSKQEKKDLQKQYKGMKPDMGIFAIINRSDTTFFLEATQDLKGTMNSSRFKLNFGSHPNKCLQKEWKEIGEDGFEIKILEKLDYDNDETKTDYSEELALLKMIWIEKLEKESSKQY